MSALVAIDRMVESARAGRYTPAHGGPVTIDDQVREIARQIVELEREARGDRSSPVG